MLYKLDIIPDDAPVAEPVSLAELRTHLRVDTSDADERALVTALGIAGRAYIEARCRITIKPTTFLVSYDSIPACGYIELPPNVRPLISVAAVNVIPEGGDGGETESLDISDWYLDDKGISSRIVFIGTVNHDDVPNAIQVTCTAGYAAGTCPELLKLAIKAWAAANYEQREAVIVGKSAATLPHAFDAILSQFSKPEV